MAQLEEDKEALREEGDAMNVVRLNRFNQTAARRNHLSRAMFNYPSVDTQDKRKKRRKCDLLAKEVVAIYECLEQQKMSHAQTAAKFNIKLQLVQYLAAKKRDAKFIDKQ